MSAMDQSGFLSPIGGREFSDIHHFLQWIHSMLELKTCFHDALHARSHKKNHDALHARQRHPAEADRKANQHSKRGGGRKSRAFGPTKGLRPNKIKKHIFSFLLLYFISSLVTLFFSCNPTLLL